MPRSARPWHWPSAEKQCCPFFDVSLALEADRRTLVLAVPDGAEEVLAAFVRCSRG